MSSSTIGLEAAKQRCNSRHTYLNNYVTLHYPRAARILREYVFAVDVLLMEIQ